MQASGLPGVAVLGIGGLANVEFSPDVVEIVVLGENDDASRKAIDKAAPSLIEKGVKVRVAQPPQGFGDFNDLIDPSKEGGGPGGLVIAKMIIEAAPEWRPKRAGAKANRATETGRRRRPSLSISPRPGANLFCDPAGRGLRRASSPRTARASTARPTTSGRKSFNRWLRLLYYAEKNGGAILRSDVVGGQDPRWRKRITTAIGDDVYLRTAPLDGKIYLDMCDPLWRAIEIDADGFRVLDDPPVHFRRESGMLPLPSPSTIDPKKGIARLREVLRLRDKRDFVVIVAWLLAALAGRSPYAVLAFLGEPGATKTSAAYAVALDHRPQRFAAPGEAEGSA